MVRSLRKKEHPFGLAFQEAHHSLDVGLVGLGLHVLYGSLELFRSPSVYDLKCDEGVKDTYSEGIAVERRRGHRYMKTKDILVGIALGLDWGSIQFEWAWEQQRDAARLHCALACAGHSMHPVPRSQYDPSSFPEQVLNDAWIQLYSCSL